MPAARPLLKYSLVIDQCLQDAAAQDGAFEEFCELTRPAIDPTAETDEAAAFRSLFLEWLIFDRVDEQGKTPLARYAENPPAGIVEQIVDEFRQSVDTHRSGMFWVVEARATDEAVVLEDVASGERFEVTDTAMSAGLSGQPGGLLGVRIVQVNGAWYFPGNPVSFMPIEPTDNVRQAMRDSFPAGASFADLVAMTYQGAPEDAEDMVVALQLDGKTAEERAEILAELEQDFTAIAAERGLSVSWEALARAVREEDGTGTPNDVLRSLFGEELETLFDSQELLMQTTSIFFNAWNLLPHDSLGGKSPVELYDEAQRA